MSCAEDVIEACRLILFTGLSTAASKRSFPGGAQASKASTQFSKIPQIRNLGLSSESLQTFLCEMQPSRPPDTNRIPPERDGSMKIFHWVIGHVGEPAVRAAKLVLYEFERAPVGLIEFLSPIARTNDD